MPANALNYFEPYESLPAHHENQLTRALVVVLKLSPMAHGAWLRRVDPTLALHELEPVEWRVQRRDIMPAPVDEPERLRVISVFISGERTDAGGEVVPSERGQVLDAIAVYGSELALVIENKVTGEPDDWQARSLNIGGLTLTLDREPQRLRWRDLLGDLADLASRGLVAGAEAGVIEDFLEYTEAHFETLLPFSTLRVCRGSAYRQQRRLRSVLTEASGIEARQDRRPSVPLPGATSVDRAYLELADEEIALNIWPADTLQQARALYTRPEAIDGLRGLRTVGWRLRPEFHFGHMAKGLAHTHGPLPVDGYMDLWIAEIARTRQVKREDWDKYWEWLLEHGLAVPNDRGDFRRHFDDTQRQDATPRPGLRLQRAWGLQEAEALDDERGRLVNAVRSALIEVIDALGESVDLHDSAQGVSA